ncbi:MAG: ABC transporter permease [Chitinophagaceae bacterium]|nr:ABC transporter permease [Chitinophagaceae bacterium]MCW5926668.1 ABC transporter permease [Chitinophagaceae bacterium]
MSFFLRSVFRLFWRQKLFTILNIFGLAISISACWIIYRIVDYEFSYERGLKNKDNIYRVISGFVFDEKEQYNGGVSKPLYQGIREQIDGIDYAVPVFGIGLKALQVNHSAGEPLVVDAPEDIAATDSSYFHMLPYRWIVGNASTALLAPNSVVLTESRAEKYFPGKKAAEILNQTITYFSYRDTITRTVTGIVTDYKAPTEFTTQEFCPLPAKAYELSEWTNTNGSDRLYLQLKHGVDANKITVAINSLSAQKNRAFEQGGTSHFTVKRWHELLPLKQSHFATFLKYGDRKASKPVLYGITGIGLFLLLLACINYINMSVAAIPQRAKEIGVRKTLGSSRTQLIGQFLGETIITTLLAGMVSYIVSKLGFRLLKDIIPPEVTLFSGIFQLIGFIMVLSIVVTFLAGLYPAWLITKVKAVNVFKNTSFRLKNSNGFSLQKALIVFQFVIALTFIASTLIVGRQLHYVLRTDMGFNKDAVVLANISWKYAGDKNYRNRQFSLLTELKTIPGIQDISLGDEPMSGNTSSGMYKYIQEGKEPVERQVFRKMIDTGYLGLYGIELLAGRNLHASDTTHELVINETAVRAFGFNAPQDAIGKFIGQEDEKLPIVGVAKDFYQKDFYTTIDPLAFRTEKSQLTTFNIKLRKDPSQWQNTLKAVEAKWYRFYPPGSFTYKFYDETIAKMYEQERHLATLINIATFISIFISCLGLFGLAALTAFQRTKEIGIRKVLGASVTGIVQLLSREYIGLVIIATVIATPIAWWTMSKWLEKFAYRITIEWWMFGLAGVAAITIALFTVSFQAIRAAMANPVKNLRNE